MLQRQHAAVSPSPTAMPTTTPTTRPRHARTPPPRPPIAVHRHGDVGRAEVESFVRAVYARRFGARLGPLAATLVSVRDAACGSRVVAAAGYRDAVDGPLFVERYLDAPVERVLQQHLGHDGALPREGIVEVGNLAALPLQGRRIIVALAAHLMQLRRRWVVSTLTRPLRLLFARLGVQPIELARADPSRLGFEAAGWGSYYAHDPIVCAARLPLAASRLLGREPA
jgi:hypothetical protein